jgi:quinol monooxygenase YgiN
MTIGVIATITIQEGQNAAFEQAFLALAEQVRANEPGNIFYILHRSKTDPQVYKVLAPLVAAAPQVEVLDTV